MLVSALIATFAAREDNFKGTSTRSHVRDDIKEAIANRPLYFLLILAGLSTFSVMILEPLITV
ncbi:hypothetical protein ABIA61_002229 [Paenibacillus sp. RC21]